MWPGCGPSSIPSPPIPIPDLKTSQWGIYGFVGQDARGFQACLRVDRVSLSAGGLVKDEAAARLFELLDAVADWTFPMLGLPEAPRGYSVRT